ncbi:AAA family ATPase [Stenotrophomonas maltophilia]|uniref:AAA family ATPase n=1 Tax=Stenotrophomonas maltophilia TaxID=40324 RepID=UPI000C15D22C|nr:AAA family ATPase [Stenotrophomonas maltophilia]
MIRDLRIQGFKCFSDLSLRLAPMTALCGPNAGGKSTILQAILLHHCGMAKSNIPVNGPFGLQFGDADSLFNRDLHGDLEGKFTISIQPGAVVEFSSSTSARVLDVKSTRTSESQNSMIYLSAERFGPRLVQPEFSSQGMGEFDVGFAGQYTAEVLGSHERDRMREELIPGSDSVPGLLLPLVEYYMSQIFGAIEVQVRANGNAPPSMYFKRPGVQEDWVLSTHTGFGITYALPVVVAGLTAEVGSTFIIDSPEAHLHPSAQTAISKFLSMLAATGVNVLIETHSDYIIDGIRIAVTSKESNGLRKEDCLLIAINSGRDGSSSLAELTMGDDGRPSDWPRGFFDQHIANMRSLHINTRSSRKE